MAKLFSVKLANLENEMNELKQNCSTKSLANNKTDELQQQINDMDAKINQMVTELTEILNQHATAIKELTSIVSGNK